MGLSDKEFDGIYDAYKSLLVYGIKHEIVSKRKLRASHFISRQEYDALCQGVLREHLMDQLEGGGFRRGVEGAAGDEEVVDLQDNLQD